MQKYRYYLPPRSKLPFAAGILAGLMTLNTIYTLISMPYYTHYWDYWATMVSGILLCGFCFLFRNRHAELTLIPAAMLALIACITPNLIHWMEVGLFFLLLLEWLVRMPRWTGKLFESWAFCSPWSAASPFCLPWQSASPRWRSVETLSRRLLSRLLSGVWAATC